MKNKLDQKKHKVSKNSSIKLKSSIVDTASIYGAGLSASKSIERKPKVSVTIKRDHKRKKSKDFARSLD